MLSTADIIAACGVLAIVVGALGGFLISMAVSIGVLKQAATSLKESIAAVHRRMDEESKYRREENNVLHQKLDTLVDDHGAKIIEITAALLENDIKIPSLAVNGRGR